MKMKILTLMKPMQSFKDQKSQIMDSSFPNLPKSHQSNKSFACLRSLLIKNHKTGTSTILLIFWTKIWTALWITLFYWREKMSRMDWSILRYRKSTDPMKTSSVILVKIDVNFSFLNFVTIQANLASFGGIIIQKGK